MKPVTPAVSIDARLTRLCLTTVALAVALALPALAGAAEPRKGKEVAGTSAASTDPVSYAQEPLDLDARTLPHGYHGHSCDAVVRKLGSLGSNFAKDEFETTAAYQQRMQKVGATTLYGTTTVADPIAFEPPTKLSAKYDADNQSMSIELPVRPFDKAPSGSRLQAVEIVRSTLKQERTYRTLDASGRPVTVLQSAYDVCGIAFDVPGDLTIPLTRGTFTIAAENARRVKDRLGAVYVGHLVPPFYIEYQDKEAPTSGMPVASQWLGRALVMRAESVWIYDLDSGAVLAKLPAFVE